MKSPHACENHANSLECWRNLNPARSAPEQRPEGTWSPGAPLQFACFHGLWLWSHLSRLPFPRPDHARGCALDLTSPFDLRRDTHGFLNPVLWKRTNHMKIDQTIGTLQSYSTSSMLTRPSDANPFVRIVPKRGFLSFFFLLGLCGDEVVDAFTLCPIWFKS